MEFFLTVYSVWYLGHLNHVGELCKAGNGNHVLVGFKFCAERRQEFSYFKKYVVTVFIF